MSWAIRRAVVLLVPIAWSWYRARQRTRDGERRRAVQAGRETGAPPG
jgi:hypothetical protein